ncbi:unnamed protein product [Allacma fusca]|uniref:ETS domain-containing protein n=1 Tax=Allacma fusca TaxID=39272 RepID=A0A8J2JRB1_9HEXA|nr:unnamed protein product [Allacma fusca]
MIQMEEQTVPSAGFSPQPNSYDSEYMSKFTTTQANYGSVVVTGTDESPNYCLAETFDLSLLGDYDDNDMATVPSPSWMPGSTLEPTSWQQVSLYASSPSTDYRAFSPDIKPALSPVHHFSSDNYSSTSPMCNSPTPSNNSNNHIMCNIGNGKALSPEPMGIDRNLLLRQCLEDTSFQQKYNFKPLDIPSASLLLENDAAVREIGPTSESSSFELNQIEPVFSMAFEHIRAEIQTSCNALGISPDPMQWSGSDVRSWLTHTLSSLPGTMMSGSGSSNMTSALHQFWNLDGRALCSFTEEEFRLRDPIMGNHIFNTLELWKTLQPKSGSTQLPNTQSEVSFPNNNIFDLGQLLLSTNVKTEITTLGDSPSTPSVPEVPSNAQPLEAARSPSSFPSPPEQMNTDDDEDEEDEEEEKKPAGKKGTNGTKSGAHIHLWQFLKELLASPQQHGSCIRWLDQSRGVFKIEDSVRVARLWGLRKNRPAMNYDKLSRSIRQYYRKGIMKKTERSQRLVYQFCHPFMQYLNALGNSCMCMGSPWSSLFATFVFNVGSRHQPMFCLGDGDSRIAFIVRSCSPLIPQNSLVWRVSSNHGSAALCKDAANCMSFMKKNMNLV